MDQLKTATGIAESLLQIKAIKLNPANPFTWASGWHSPIYCDNRRILSFPEVRDQVASAFAEMIAELYPEAEIVAGVATGAIAHGVLAADRLQKPFIYVRSSPKAHGLANQIEGSYEKGAKVVVVEDLISTGGSSLSAVEALRDAGCEVLGMVAIFTYGFDTAVKNFETAGVTLHTLSNYSTLIPLAARQGYVTADQIETLGEWRRDPSVWKQEK
jgi:orotate phosphoribosyltransferase